MRMAETMNLPELTLPQMLRQRAQRDAQRVAIRQKDFGIWKPVTWSRPSAVAMQVLKKPVRMA